MELGWFNEVVRNNMERGDTLKFWTDKWMGRESLAGLLPSLYSSCEMQDARVSEMGGWNQIG